MTFAFGEMYCLAFCQRDGIANRSEVARRSILLGTLLSFVFACLFVDPALAQLSRQETQLSRQEIEVARQFLQSFDDAYKRGDFAEVLRYARPWAEAGLPHTQYLLCRIYDRGEGVPRDYTQAVSWCVRSADQGYSNAQSYLGYLYWLGHGLPKNVVTAYMWISLAAGSPDAGDTAKNAREALDELETLMVPTQIAEAQRLAREWRPRSTQTDWPRLMKAARELGTNLPDPPK